MVRPKIFRASGLVDLTFIFLFLGSVFRKELGWLLFETTRVQDSGILFEYPLLASLDLLQVNY